MTDVVHDPSDTPTAHGGADFAERYRAISARDARFDGQFFTAVRTTGIYCRPSCPARTPKPENVRFYLTSAAAHDAGFRACKRCLPEATPGTPEWNLRRDLAGRAMRLIADGVVDREGVDGLATRLGYSARQVNRLLVTELGAGPLALARAQRAQTARTLLTGTDLKLADVAFAAGFGSIRQFNETMTDVFASTPTEIRRRATGARAGSRAGSPVLPAYDSPAAREGTGCVTDRPLLHLSLPVRRPFDARGVFGFLAARAIDGVETADLTGPHLRYARTVSLPHGPAAFELRCHAGPGSVDVTLEVSHLADVPVAAARIRRLLDLDADPVAVDQALGADPALAAGVAAAPGIRVPGAVDPAELLIRAIIGQQISVAAARTHLTRLTAAAGAPYDSAVPGLTRLFPTPGAVADAAGDHLRLPARNLATITATATALADGELPLSIGDDPSDLRERLVARPGIGPWTAGYVALRVLGDPDILMDRDVALLAGARNLGLVDPGLTRPDQFRALATRGAAWAPWRSYAAMHLWRAAAA
ncbi:AlkA N-terminal domain-containing protein [Myceligenerans crystallogenes]|uniref:DNA-3-methyladenine glycosylase II n=1 Tax=Myceligenerans crystallogenes TaxID=316335 RepID=A0ABP4ZQV1_9MICO